MKIFDAIGVRDPNHWGFLIDVNSSAFAIRSMNSNVTFVPVDVNIVVRSITKHNWERIFSGVFVTLSDKEICSSGHIFDVSVQRFAPWRKGYVVYAFHMVSIDVVKVHQPLSLQVQKKPSALAMSVLASSIFLDVCEFGAPAHFNLLREKIVNIIN